MSLLLRIWSFISLEFQHFNVWIDKSHFSMLKTENCVFCQNSFLVILFLTQVFFQWIFQYFDEEHLFYSKILFQRYSPRRTSLGDRFHVRSYALFKIWPSAEGHLQSQTCKREIFAKIVQSRNHEFYIGETQITMCNSTLLWHLEVWGRDCEPPDYPYGEQGPSFWKVQLK